MDTKVILVQYDKEIKKITGVKNQVMKFQGKKTFPYLLLDIFTEFPLISKTYKPGQMGFLINNIPPHSHTMVEDGDTIKISSHN